MSSVKHPTCPVCGSAVFVSKKYGTACIDTVCVFACGIPQTAVMAGGCAACGARFHPNSIEAQRHVCRTILKPQTAVLPAPLPEREPMRCRATGPDWRTGALLPDCQMPHGHHGPCDWSARLIGDAELRAECERRGMYTDDHLDQRIIDVNRDYADMKREHDKARELWRKCNATVCKEREHWKTVAESAAAERDAARAALNDERERVCALENARARGATPDHYEQSQDCRERGSGIAATKPDNSAYFDERDLLADDA